MHGAWRAGQSMGRRRSRAPPRSRFLACWLGRSRLARRLPPRCAGHFVAVRMKPSPRAWQGHEGDTMRTPFSAFVDGTVARFVFVSALIPSVVSGLDGASSLPSLSFSYTSARLGGVDNGIGGAVRFSDERGKATVPLYRAGVYTAYEYGGACAGYYLSLSPNPVCGGTVAGYLMDSHVTGTSPASTVP